MPKCFVNRWLKITDTQPRGNDWTEFDSPERAQAFITRFATPTQPTTTRCPYIICKRRHIVLSSMGLKNSLTLDYLKPLPPNTLVNLYDQTFALTVRITNITPKPGNQYVYQFELA